MGWPSRFTIIFGASVMGVVTLGLFAEVLPFKEVGGNKKPSKKEIVLKDLSLKSPIEQKAIKRLPANVEPYTRWKDPEKPIYLFGTCIGDSGRRLGPLNKEYHD